MPTGYTAKVQDGTITSLKDFALCCARNFDALITMRDEPFDASIPESFKPNTVYYDELISEAQSLIIKISGLSTPECEQEATIEYVDALDSYKGYKAERALHRTRYKGMMEKIEAWIIPAELEKLKDFMCEQLSTSIDHDCRNIDSYYPEPTKLSGEDWRVKSLKKAAKDLSYGIEERDKEIARVKDRNQWLQTLRQSLEGL